MHERPTVVVVDPYSSGALLAPELTACGWASVAVRTSPRIPDAFASSYRPQDFVEVIAHDGDLASTTSHLERHAVRAVTPGCETGVLVADALSERLGLPTNGTARSEARRDKFLMAQLAARDGVRIPRQYRAPDAEELLHWVRANLEWPVVVKPLASCASDQVHRCQNPDDVKRAAHAILNRRNMLGLTNDAVLGQEMLRGEEFVVDTVSCDGHHALGAVWAYHRPLDVEEFIGYDAMELLPNEGERQAALFAFACRVLDALEIRHGPAHCEVMWTGDGPVLVEIGARMNADPVLSRLCGGRSTLDLTLECLTAPERFATRVDEPNLLTHAAAHVFLIPPRRARLAALPRLGELETLASFHAMNIGVEPGDTLPRVAGYVTLRHRDRAVVDADIRRVRGIQRDGFFALDD